MLGRERSFTSRQMCLGLTLSPILAVKKLLAIINATQNQTPVPGVCPRLFNFSAVNRQTSVMATLGRPVFGARLHSGLRLCTTRNGEFWRGTTVYGPYGGAGGWAAYNSRTHNARGGAVYGPYGTS